MTELLYQTDSYLKEFDATVTRTTENGVVLDRTAFYPQGGGQPSDTGVLISGDKEYRVTAVRKEAGEVIHVTEGDLPDAGAKVHGVIDWDHRYALMRYHTALHVLCEVVFREFGAQVTGGNMEEDHARMDFELEDLNPERVAFIERRANEEIAAGHRINVRILPRDEAFQIPDLIRTKINLLPPEIENIRTVEIEGLDLQADGGTHVANTKEVGSLKVVGVRSKGRINKRLQIVVV
jgi:misacylated tRNA(Ala) deacylase